MKFVVVGVGNDGSDLAHPKDTLADAGITAFRMADGLDGVRIFDEDGKEYSLEEGWKAFRQSKPEGGTFR